MKEGDPVRFASDWRPESVKDKIGLLVEHDKLMGTAHVLYEGKVLKLRVSQVEKAGKKDAAG